MSMRTFSMGLLLWCVRDTATSRVGYTGRYHSFPARRSRLFSFPKKPSLVSSTDSIAKRKSKEEVVSIDEDPFEDHKPPIHSRDDGDNKSSSNSSTHAVVDDINQHTSLHLLCANEYSPEASRLVSRATYLSRSTYVIVPGIGLFLCRYSHVPYRSSTFLSCTLQTISAFIRCVGHRCVARHTVVIMRR